MQRRDFLKLLSVFPFLNPSNALSIESNTKRKYLILIELKGGNDGLNTVIPYKDPLYYENRPTLQIPVDKVLKINSELGLNPALPALKKLYQDDDLSIIQNVGYNSPNKSHFTSLDIWESASRDKEANGWLYELFKKNPSNNLIDAMVFSGSTGLFEGSSPNFLKVKNLNNFLKRSKSLKIPNYLLSDPTQKHLLDSIKLIKKVALRLENELNLDEIKHIKKERVGISDQLMQVSSLMQSNVSIPVFKVSINNFDTHANQSDIHKKNLTELNNSLDKFIKNLKFNGLWNDALIMTYSEFGRRILENGSKGTDHGEASCMFCMGGKVKGGIHGKLPDLLNNNGNVATKIDFKEVYATLQNEWFKVDKRFIKNTPLNFL